MKFKIKVDPALIIVVLFISLSIVASWYYAASEYALDGRFEVDFIGGFLMLFFSGGFILSIVTKFQGSKPDGLLTTNEWIENVDSLNLK